MMWAVRYIKLFPGEFVVLARYESLVHGKPAHYPSSSFRRSFFEREEGVHTHANSYSEGCTGRNKKRCENWSRGTTLLTNYPGRVYLVGMLVVCRKRCNKVMATPMSRVIANGQMFLLCELFVRINSDFWLASLCSHECASCSSERDLKTEAGTIKGTGFSFQGHSFASRPRRSRFSMNVPALKLVKAKQCIIFA